MVDRVRPGDVVIGSGQTPSFRAGDPNTAPIVDTSTGEVVGTAGAGASSQKKLGATTKDGAGPLDAAARGGAERAGEEDPDTVVQEVRELRKSNRASKTLNAPPPRTGGGPRRPRAVVVPTTTRRPSPQDAAARGGAERAQEAGEDDLEPEVVVSQTRAIRKAVQDQAKRQEAVLKGRDPIQALASGVSVGTLAGVDFVSADLVKATVFVDTLSSKDRSLLASVGLDKFNKAQEARFNASTVAVGPKDERILKRDFDALPAKAQRAVKREGAAALDTDGLTPEQEFTKLKDLGFVPPNAIFTGPDKKGRPTFVDAPTVAELRKKGKRQEIDLIGFQKPTAAEVKALEKRKKDGFFDPNAIKDVNLPLTRAREALGEVFVLEGALYSIKNGAVGLVPPDQARFVYDKDESARRQGLAWVAMIPVVGTVIMWKRLSRVERGVAVGLDIATVALPLLATGRVLRALQPIVRGPAKAELAAAQRANSAAQRALMADLPASEAARIGPAAKATVQSTGRYMDDLAKVQELEKALQGTRSGGSEVAMAIRRDLDLARRQVTLSEQALRASAKELASKFKNTPLLGEGTAPALREQMERLADTIVRDTRIAVERAFQSKRPVAAISKDLQAAQARLLDPGVDLAKQPGTRALLTRQVAMLEHELQVAKLRGVETLRAESLALRANVEALRQLKRETAAVKAGQRSVATDLPPHFRFRTVAQLEKAEDALASMERDLLQRIRQLPELAAGKASSAGGGGTATTTKPLTGPTTGTRAASGSTRVGLSPNVVAAIEGQDIAGAANAARASEQPFGTVAVPVVAAATQTAKPATLATVSQETVVAQVKTKADVATVKRTRTGVGTSTRTRTGVGTSTRTRTGTATSTRTKTTAGAKTDPASESAPAAGVSPQQGGATATATTTATTTPPAEPGRGKGAKAAGALRFKLPGGQQLPAGVFPRELTWKQGFMTVTHDLFTNERSFRRSSTSGTPEDTFKVVATTKRRPPEQQFKLGIVRVIVTGKGLRYHLAKLPRSPRARMPRQRMGRR